jgi:hypothetical protein
MSRAELLSRWTSRRAEFERLGISVVGAKLCDEFLRDLDQLWREECLEELTLQEAAAASGYSPDHLRRLHRQGKLRAERRGRRLFFQAAGLPKKPAAVDAAPAREYDPIAHARQVAARRSHGGSSHDAQEAA